MNKETLDQIFGLARIEVLDGIKQDFIKWVTAVGFIITILGLIGANAAIQHAVEDRVRTTLDSFREEIQKAQVNTQLAKREIEQVQAIVSEKTKELISLETALKDEMAKGNDLSAVLQRGLKEYFQIRSLAATYYVSFDGGLSTALSTTFGGVRFPGAGQAAPDIASASNLFLSIINPTLELRKSTNSGFSIPFVLNFLSRDGEIAIAKLSPDVLQLDALGARSISFLDGIDRILLGFSPALDTASIRQGNVQRTFGVDKPISDVKDKYEQGDSEKEPQERGPSSTLRPL